MMECGIGLKKEGGREGQKFRSRRNRQRKRGLHDSRRRAEDRRGGVFRKAQIVQKKESRRMKLMYRE